MSLSTAQKRHWMPKFNLLKNKQTFISQINNGTIAVRRMDEDCMDENSGMNFAEFVAVLSGNTDLLDKTKPIVR